MRQPKLSNLKIDVEGTKKIRSKMAKVKKVKITINVDSDILSEVKERAEETGIPYQNFINRLLRSAIAGKSEELSRLDRLESELKKLKKKVS